MKYTAPKLHKLWIKEKIGEGVFACSDGNMYPGSCLNGTTPDLVCQTGTTAGAGCTTGNSASFSCGPGYGVT